jgi:hydroxyacid-oxoacid transhydrogenase
MTHEIAFEMAASSVRFGAGVTREVGMDLADLGTRQVLVITDPTIRGMRPFQTVLESMDAEGIACTIYDRVRVRPNDESSSWMRSRLPGIATTARLSRWAAAQPLIRPRL